jgi:CRP-like cAMP-binding protein
LARVPPDERRAFAGQLEEVAFETCQVLYEPGDALTHVYLPASGMLTLIAVMADGRGIETATVGREGAVGLSASGYLDEAFTRVVVQVPGDGHRIAAADFEELIDRSVAFCSAVVRWREVLTRTALQAVACNAVHDVRKRAARWMLTTHDRTAKDRLPLTQEVLAEMLGVRRNAVSVVAREFQSSGLIEYSRGRVTVVDRPGLEATACECYRLIRAEVTKLTRDPPSPECND